MATMQEPKKKEEEEEEVYKHYKHMHIYSTAH